MPQKATLRHLLSLFFDSDVGQEKPTEMFLIVEKSKHALSLCFNVQRCYHNHIAYISPALSHRPHDPARNTFCLPSGRRPTSSTNAPFTA